MWTTLDVMRVSARRSPNPTSALHSRWSSPSGWGPQARPMSAKMAVRDVLGDVYGLREDGATDTKESKRIPVRVITLFDGCQREGLTDMVTNRVST